MALPPDRVTGAPKLMPSIANCTVPVRVPAPGATGLTVAVNVTDWPDTDGLADEVSVVVVSDWFTVWLKAEDVLVLKLPSPL